jgi:outer membrane receptor protein involved in Fe transport
MAAASETTVSGRELSFWPLDTPSDLLRVVPALVIGQHAGGGKADQILLRGFDADHGTDVAVSVDGVPNNLVSHAHGQGYADLHWLIPEVVEGVEARRGPYFADQGDFGTAGAVRFITRDRFDAPLFRIAHGSFATTRLLAAGSPTIGPFATVLAAEAHATDGPFLDRQDLRRVNLFAKATRPLAEGGRFALTATAYDASWNASGQIPERAVASGAIDPYGAIDPTEGGRSHRYSIAASWAWQPSAASSGTAHAFAVDYGLDLFSNFTFYAGDPVNGDGIEQVDDRRYYGAGATRRWVAIAGDTLFETVVGGSARFDGAGVGLHRQRGRERLATVNDAAVRQASAGLFIQEEVTLHPRLRLAGGLRYDAFRFDVRSRLPATAGGAAPEGTAVEAILQPKAAVIVSLPSETDLFLNYGVGFHSNDARSTVINESGFPALPRSAGYEIGARSRPAAWDGRIDLAASVWRLDIENEFVYVGDEGGTEVRGRSRRSGIEVGARAQVARWLWADLDAAWSRAEFTGTGAPVPLAPTRVISGGLASRLAHGWSWSVRARHLADRPAEETGRFVARGYTVLDTRLAWERGPLEYALEVANLTGADYREAQFYNESRLPDEPAPVGDIHFTPGSPRSWRFDLTWRY